MSVLEKLMIVQSRLKAPKSQFNNFGNYNYRNCEDILEALKPLLSEVRAAVIISDDIVMIGQRYYIKSTAVLIDTESGDKIENIAFAREEESKKGMDASQVTGSSSSYARKYALNGLFGIDDTKDSDTTNTEEKGKSKAGKTADMSAFFTGEVTFKMAEDLYEAGNVTGYSREKLNTALWKNYHKKIYELTEEEYKRAYNDICKCFGGAEAISSRGKGRS